ncbi:unnamed protein product, partial [Scytosiphon promiscuus]
HDGCVAGRGRRTVVALFFPLLLLSFSTSWLRKKIIVLCLFCTGFYVRASRPVACGTTLCHDEASSMRCRTLDSMARVPASPQIAYQCTFAKVMLMCLYPFTNSNDYAWAFATQD